MNEFHSAGKFLIITGIVLVIAGLIVSYWDRIPMLGKLPGDIKIEGRNFMFYFPLASSIIISIIISLVLYLFRK
ncbi:MAG TPA: DUF2905 domain-containing protein [Melioribacteraceae bacterium]|nr:DUF2905 domain-containing protein [Melioribacteraceae bacterium]